MTHEAYELDLAKVESVCWRALCRHQVSELEMVVSATVIRLSFVIGQPFLHLDHAIALAQLTGLSKGKAHDVVKRLVRSRALEVSLDRRIYTFLPPSQAWPWLFAPRVEGPIADELEAGIVWANTGVSKEWQALTATGDREFTEALAIERMRAGLIEQHQAATARFSPHKHFPVKDRQPKPAPASADRCEPERPLGTGTDSCQGVGPESLADGEPPTSYYFHPPKPDEFGEPVDGARFPKREPAVPDSGTESSRFGNSPLSALSASVYSVQEKKTTDTKALSALSDGFPNREPEPPAWSRRLDPAANENEILDWLRGVLGWQIMEQWGGFWRNACRECRRGVLETICNFKLRVQTRGMPDSPGGWMRDQYGRFRRVINQEARE